MKVIVCCCFLLLSISISGQQYPKFSASQFDSTSLKKEFGQNKNFIPSFQLATLVALSFYPELKDSWITFRLVNEKSTAKTTISFVSLLLNNKRFIIYINKNESTTGLDFSQLSFNAQVGAIAHELAHVVDFNDRGLPGMMIWAIQYLRINQRRKIERSTDGAVIDHQLGWQLYDFTNYVLQSPKTTGSYKNFKLKFYLHPDEIVTRINRSK